MQTAELNNISRITVDTTDKLSTDTIKEIVDLYLNGKELKLLQKYDHYYEAENVFITDKVRDKSARDKTPNNYVPTAYYSNVVDTMAGYMFDDVQYLPKKEVDKGYSEALNQILEANGSDVKDMKTGVRSLAYNKGIELVYTVGDSKSTADIKYTDIDPRQMILVYDNAIEPDVFCAIWVRLSSVKDVTYKIDVIYNNEWQYYNMDDKNLTEREEPRDLYFSQCPVVLYHANDMNMMSTFNKIIQYIDALDYILTGNANDIEKLTDAVLVMTKILSNDELNHMDDMKAIFGVDKEEDILPYFLERQTDPTFREYNSKLVIQEIHKHAHVVDWYSPDSGLTGEVSAKAMITRLFDMNMSSKKVEKVHKKGAQKKISLITELMNIIDLPTGEIDIVYNRTLPDDFENLAKVLNELSFISDETKMEKLGIDVEREKERLKNQRESGTEPLELEDFTVEEPREDEVE